MIIKKEFTTEDGEIYTNVPYDTKTQQWLYGASWEDIKTILEISKEEKIEITLEQACIISARINQFNKNIEEKEDVIFEIQNCICEYDSMIINKWG